MNDAIETVEGLVRELRERPRGRPARFALACADPEKAAEAVVALLASANPRDIAAALDFVAQARGAWEEFPEAAAFLDRLEADEATLGRLRAAFDEGDGLVRDAFLDFLPSWPELPGEDGAVAMREIVRDLEPLLSYKYLYWRSLAATGEELAEDGRYLAAGGGRYAAWGALSFGCDVVPAPEDFAPVLEAARGTFSVDDPLRAYADFAERYVAVSAANALDGRTVFTDSQAEELRAMACELSFQAFREIAISRLDASGGSRFSAGELEALESSIRRDLARAKGSWRGVSGTRVVLAAGGGNAESIDEAARALARGERQAILDGTGISPGESCRERSEEILGADLVVSKDGDAASLLQAWDEAGLDRALREAHGRGTTLAGRGAGAVAWFAAGIVRGSGVDSGGDGPSSPAAGAAPSGARAPEGTAGAYGLVEGYSIARGVFCPRWNPADEAQVAAARKVSSLLRAPVWLVPEKCALLVADGRYLAINPSRPGDGSPAPRVERIDPRGFVEPVPEVGSE